MGKFTVEEINLMCVFGTENRSKLIADMKNVLPHFNCLIQGTAKGRL